MKQAMEHSGMKQWFLQLKIPENYNRDNDTFWIVLHGNLLHPPIYCEDPRESGILEEGDQTKDIKTQIMESGGIPDFLPDEFSTDE